jgi:hypothetical protein
MMNLSESDQITTDHINCCEKCYFSNITHEINGGCSTVALPVAVGGVVASEPATSDTSVPGVTTTLHPLVFGTGVGVSSSAEIRVALAFLWVIATS